LACHSEGSKTELVGSRPLDEPKEVSTTMIFPDKKSLGKTLKKDCKILCDYIETLNEELKQEFHKKYEEAEKEMEINCGEKNITVPKESIVIKIETKKTIEEKFAPHVIEPSFGIGRVIFCIFEH
jgi:glycyl-tRNA synthetase